MAELTQQQREAVEIEGDTLVMAGAGTGKTHTLIERILHFALRDQNPIPLDRFLVVTFTEAAAAELRRRLREAILEKHEASPHDVWVATQVARLDETCIGTLHGYCLRLLRENFHDLGLDPNLRTLDEADAERLGWESVQTVFDRFLENDDAVATDVRRWWKRLFRGDLDSAARALCGLYAEVRALEDPAAWLTKEEIFWQSAEPNVWRERLLDELRRWAEGWFQRGSSTNDPVWETNPAWLQRRPILRELSTLLQESRSLSAVSAALQELVEGDQENWPVRKKTYYRSPLEAFFEEAEAFAGWLVPGRDGSDPLQEDWSSIRELMQTTLVLWRKFDAEYCDRKRERSVIDFADQEQLALTLLGRGTHAGETAVAAAERKRFEWVLVDECQDLNAAQAGILRAVSRQGEGGASKPERRNRRWRW